MVNPVSLLSLFSGTNIMNFAPRVSMPYDELSAVVPLWAAECHKMVVFEHTPDHEDPTTHCHFLLQGSKVAEEALKRRFYDVIDTQLKSNKLWAWKHKDHPVIESLDTSGGQQYLTYMTKGELAAKYLKNITWLDVETAKSRWVAPPTKEMSAEAKGEFDILLRYLESKHSGSVPHIDVIRSDICYHYLSRRKAVPRGGDLSRYAYSAYMIMNANKAKPDQREVALRSQISSFLLSLDSGNIK